MIIVDTNVLAYFLTQDLQVLDAYKSKLVDTFVDHDYEKTIVFDSVLFELQVVLLGNISRTLDLSIKQQVHLIDSFKKLLSLRGVLYCSDKMSNYTYEKSIKTYTNLSSNKLVKKRLTFIDVFLAIAAKDLGGELLTADMYLLQYFETL